MVNPKRVQRSRLPGSRLPDGVVYVGRPTRWGNPFWVGSWRSTKPEDGHVETVEEAVELFRRRIAPWLPVQELRGRDLACWCPPDRPCHADVLLELANAGAEKDTHG